MQGLVVGGRGRGRGIFPLTGAVSRLGFLFASTLYKTSIGLQVLSASRTQSGRGVFFLTGTVTVAGLFFA